MELKQGLRYPCELLLKAIKLIQQDQIRKISDNLFIVPGTHQNPLGFYSLEKLKSGIWICNGFKNRRVAIYSHVIAVMALQSKKNMENSKKAVKENAGLG